MRTILFAVSLFFGISVNAQIKFEPGYFITNDGQKIDGFIRNQNKENNPTTFQYRLSEKGDIKVGTIDSVSSFQILNTTHKYERYTVKIERSSPDIKNLLESKDIIFKEETLFLRVLIQGTASLYVYNIGGNEKFFYQMNNGTVDPLIHYIYQGAGNTLGEMNSFREQLLKDLQCANITRSAIDRLNYVESELARLFTKFNQCKNSNYENTITMRKKEENQLAVLIGVNSSALELEQKSAPPPPSSGQTGTSPITERTSQKLSPVFGFSYTHVFATVKGAWDLIIEPSFQRYKNTLRDVILPSGAATELQINYSYLNLPIGVRRSVYMNDNGKLFLKGSVAWNLVLNQKKVFGPASTYRTINGLEQNGVIAIPHVILGAGYLMKNKYSIETRYYINNTMLNNEKWKTRFVNPFSLLLGYRLL